MRWIAAIIRNYTPKILELLDLFIDKITIYEGENVVIKFKFEDEFKMQLVEETNPRKN